jgi:transcriptional regulator with XRE-family HTH domain
MSIALSLLDQVIDAAKAASMDQARLAQAAGIAPETLSRAKKRGSMDLHTLQALAQAAGLALTLSAKAHAASAVVAPAASSRRSTLAEPAYGLAWSNASMSHEVLVRNALLKGTYHLVLEAVMAHGLPFVQQQWTLMQADPDVPLSVRARQDVSRKLRNIERGMRDAAA